VNKARPNRGKCDTLLWRDEDEMAQLARQNFLIIDWAGECDSLVLVHGKFSLILAVIPKNE
jgi:hypothetical protein